MIEATYQKTESEVLDYSIDWTAWLAGDTISTSVWTLDAGLTQDSESETTTAATVWISGGTSGKRYTAVNKIVTAASRTGEKSIEVLVSHRAGMEHLIERLRSMTATGTADYAVAGATYWKDHHLQDRLDMYARHLNRVPLRQVPEYEGGTAFYLDYYTAMRNLEEAASGTVYWAVENGDGDNAGTANYTVDYISGVVRFTVDQAGTAYYLRARSYNLERVASHIWQEKAAYSANWYEFSTDNHKFSRQQYWDHCVKMAEFYDKKSGGRSVQMARGDLG